MVDINQALQQAAETGLGDGYFFFVAFLAGILISFTPCIYPMIPITAGILHAQAGKSFLYNLLSSCAYVCGLAVVYSTLGYLSAKTSLIFGAWLANPWFITIAIMLFLYFAFSMFGFYELYMPSFLSRHTEIKKRSSLLQTFLFGMLSGTVASPCLTPALALLLGLIAKQQSPFVGVVALFCFSLGMGILLLLIGAFSSTMAMLPRAGEWMEYIKRGFGFLMLAACVNFLQPFLSNSLAMISYIFIAIIAATFYLLHTKISKISLIFGLIALLIAVALTSNFLALLRQ